MTTPTITSVTPSSGWSAGKTLVEIRGSGFRLPTPFDYNQPGIAPVPPPTVRVLFDDLEAKDVQVASNGLIRCLTPMHWPTRWYYEFGNGRREPAPPPSTESNPPDGATLVTVPGTVNVTVININDSGVPIAGESAVAEKAYEFTRPRLDQKGTWDRAVTKLRNLLRIAILDNVTDEADLDYDVDLGDVSGLTSIAKAPAIAITQKVFSDSDDPMEQGVTEEAGADEFVIRRRAPIYTDFSCRLLLISEDIVELRAMAQLVRDLFLHTNEFLLEKDPNNPSFGSYKVTLMLDRQGIQETGRIGRTNLLMASAVVGLMGIPSEWDVNVTNPGLPYDAAVGKPHEGVLGITRVARTHNIARTKLT